MKTDEYQSCSGGSIVPVECAGKSRFVTGHDFSRADCRPIELSALAAAKAQVAEMQQPPFRARFRHD
jgi:hypothetical protein